VYDLLTPEEGANATREQYVAFRSEKGPFQYLTAQIGEVTVAGDISWVQVAYDARPMNYPEVKPHYIRIWDLWHKRDTWYPVPKPQRDQFPKLPPASAPCRRRGDALQAGAQVLASQGDARLAADLPVPGPGSPGAGSS
jgi:hypothetical protein